jgi:glycosyltransferase involved in cell wall biosynthesis
MNNYSFGKKNMPGEDLDRNNLVTVVVPCYNDGEFLLENLESLQAQTYRNFEVVVVNDGSTDPKTLEVLEGLEQGFPSLDLRVYAQSNQGLSATRNRGIQEARGEWIVTLDADDLITPDYIEKTMDFAQASGLDYVVTDYQNFGEQNHIARVKVSFYEELFRNCLPVCALFKRSVLLTEPYDPDFSSGFEDWELWIRLFKMGYRGDVIHEPLYHYRRKRESMFTRTHFYRPQIIKKIREKHAELYESKNLSRVKEQSLYISDIRVWLNNIYYNIGLRSPHLAYWLLKIYLCLRPRVGI